MNIILTQDLPLNMHYDEFHGSHKPAVVAIGGDLKCKKLVGNFLIFKWL